MISEKYNALIARLPAGIVIPDSFFNDHTNENLACIFLVSCAGSDRILFMDDTCKAITGYTPDNFTKKGMDFWFPLIHPEDMHAFTSKIIRLHEELLAPGFKKDKVILQVFEYRFMHAGGHWLKMKDTKLMLFPGEEPVIDNILCKFELMVPPPSRETAALGQIVQAEKSCSRMLEFALVHQNSQRKQKMEQSVAAPDCPVLSRREKEILKLIGQGLSTKMIADQCFISVNTVETHRRHLLEKMNAKNSMELIKQASKLYWM